MKGLILINAYSESEDYLYQAERLHEEFALRGMDVPIVRNCSGAVQIGQDGRSALAQRADFVVYLDKDKYVATFLENSGVRLFNRAEAIFTCDDKMLTHAALADKGIPMPGSIPAPLCYTPETAIPDAELDGIVGALGLPLVVKHSYGSLGKQVFLAKTREELKEYAERLKLTPHFYQRYVAESFGRDLRVVVIGGKVVASMIRSSGGKDFRSNMALGGASMPYEADETIAQLAEKISRLLGLDYCGIDLLFGEGGFLVCEVNSNAYFKGIEHTTGVNVAAAYVDYILRTL